MIWGLSRCSGLQPSYWEKRESSLNKSDCEGTRLQVKIDMQLMACESKLARRGDYAAFGQTS